jgi:hypothetical protein
VQELALHFDADDNESDEVSKRTGQRLAAAETWNTGSQWLVAYRTKREVAAGRTMDISDLVSKSGDDKAPARSDG